MEAVKDVISELKSLKTQFRGLIRYSGEGDEVRKTFKRGVCIRPNIKSKK